MRLQLKEDWTVTEIAESKWWHKKGNHPVSGAFVSIETDGLYNAWPFGSWAGGECGLKSLEDAREFLLSKGSDTPWREVPTTEELTAATEGEGPVAPPVEPAPRLCAVDRLEAARYYAKPMAGLLLFRHEIYPTIDVEYIGTRCARAGVDSPHLRIKGDTVDGLNAALESLLSKPVGAVTVAQILGVA